MLRSVGQAGARSSRIGGVLVLFFFAGSLSGWSVLFFCNGGSWSMLVVSSPPEPVVTYRDPVG